MKPTEGPLPFKFPVSNAAAKKYHCPKCGAPPGTPCHSEETRNVGEFPFKGPSVRTHRERLDVVRNEGLG